MNWGKKYCICKKISWKTKTQSETLRIMIEENLEKALKREAESQKSLIEKKISEYDFLSMN